MSPFQPTTLSKYLFCFPYAGITTKSNESNRVSFNDLLVAQVQNTDDTEALLFRMLIPYADESDWFMIIETETQISCLLMLSLYRFYHARISIPFTRKVFRVFLPFFNKMFVEDSSQKNADRQRHNCNLSIFDPAREKKIKKDNWSETVLLAFFSLRKVIQYEANFINTPIM